jgi:hypothetical protein
VARDDLKLLEPVATLGRGRIRANMPLRRQRRREASEAVTGAKSYDENVEECGHFLIQPDPGCPECVAIMVWRSAHRGIAITSGAEIKLSEGEPSPACLTRSGGRSALCRAGRDLDRDRDRLRVLKAVGGPLLEVERADDRRIATFGLLVADGVLRLLRPF